MKTIARRLARLEAAQEDQTPPEPWPVLFPGDDPPQGHTGPVVRVRVLDGRKPVEEKP